jgi:hypothetical protein
MELDFSFCLPDHERIYARLLDLQSVSHGFQSEAICLPSRSFLHWFQGQRRGRARHGLCRDRKAKICPISKRFLGDFFVATGPIAKPEML